MKGVILDTGPLVAYLDRSDHHHKWSAVAFNNLIEPVFTCEAVISEACHLLGDSVLAVRKIGEMISRGVVVPDFSLQQDHQRVFALMQRYANVPMSFADACLVCMAAEADGSRVFTVDSDFTIYRVHGRKALSLIAPFA